MIVSHFLIETNCMHAQNTQESLMQSIRTTISTELDARGVCECGILAYIMGMCHYSTRLCIPVCTHRGYGVQKQGMEFKNIRLQIFTIDMFTMF